jgi:hypothetical protein
MFNVQNSFFEIGYGAFYLAAAVTYKSGSTNLDNNALASVRFDVSRVVPIANENQTRTLAERFWRRVA